MLNKLKICLLMGLFAVATAVQAQKPGKFGHMNLGNLLDNLTETKQANIALEAFVAKYSTSVDSMQKSLELEFKTFQDQYRAGSLTQVVAQERYAELEKKEKAFTAYQQSAEQAVSAKRDELLKPILEKVYEAIKAVAKENGFAMIFDTSTGAALYALETEDVTPIVLKKLGQ
ncbi:MAG: OmpH family outer membrane protein [Chitinophagales bacterium]|jgi:outer membrane protein